MYMRDVWNIADKYHKYEYVYMTPSAMSIIWASKKNDSEIMRIRCWRLCRNSYAVHYRHAVMWLDWIQRITVGRFWLGPNRLGHVFRVPVPATFDRCIWNQDTSIELASQHAHVREPGRGISRLQLLVSRVRIWYSRIEGISCVYIERHCLVTKLQWKQVLYNNMLAWAHGTFWQ